LIVYGFAVDVKCALYVMLLLTAGNSSSSITVSVPSTIHPSNVRTLSVSAAFVGSSPS
jgi:hypothetical protein